MTTLAPTIASLIRTLSATADGLKIHAVAVRTGLSTSISVQNSLLTFYAKYISLKSAHKMFDEMPVKDSVSWSAIISAYARSSLNETALHLFREMSLGEDHAAVDGFVLVSVVRACAGIGDFKLGRVVHSYAIRGGFDFELHVSNALIDMYSKCEDVESALGVFDRMPWENVVSWNSILSGLVYNGRYLEAAEVFSEMQKCGVEIDEVGVVNVLGLCKRLGENLGCKCVHGVVIRRGFEMNELVMNSVLDAYAKCDLVELAWKLFSRCEERDLFAWSTIIGGFAYCGRPDEAMALFVEMKLASQKPNSVTLLSLLEACSVSADIERLKWVHGMATKEGMMNQVTVGTAILESYARCGDVEESRQVFDEMTTRNVVSWSAMILAYGMNGQAHNALSLLRDMELHGVKPNKVTLLSALSACSHGGLVEEGFSCFKEMIHKHGLRPCPEHYSCLVDMLGRAGDLNGAMEVIKKMPKSFKGSASLWGALLSACRKHGNRELGKGAAMHVFEVEPLSSAGYFVTSGMYAEGGLWDEAARMRRLLKERRIRVVSGYTLVHLNGRACRFVAGDQSHPLSLEIYASVEHLHSCMRLQKDDAMYIV